MYVIGPEDSTPRYRRSAMLQVGHHGRRHKRAANGQLPNQPRNGTNIHFLRIDESQLGTPLTAPAIAAISLVSLLAVMATVCLTTWCAARRRRRRKSPGEEGERSNAMVMTSHVQVKACKVYQEEEEGSPLLMRKKRRNVSANLYSPAAEEKCKVRVSNSYDTPQQLRAPLVTPTNTLPYNNSNRKMGNSRTCNIKIVDNLHGGSGGKKGCREDDSGTEV